MGGPGAPLILHHGSAITGRERNLIVGYEFDAQEGMLINKEVTGLGGGSNGTIVGACQMQDRIHGKGLTFDGVNDYASYSQVGNTHSAGSIRLSFRLHTANPALVTYLHHFLLNNSRYYIAFKAVTGELRTLIKENDVAWEDTGMVPVLEKWYRLIVTWEGASVRVYVDAHEIDSYAITPLVDNITTANLGATTVPAQFFDGDMAEYSLVRRAMTDEEIKRDYLQYAPRAHYQETFRSAHVSSAATAAGRLENTWWSVTNAGATDMRVAHDLESERIFGIKNAKHILCGGDGQIWIPTQYLGLTGADPEAAYGTWEFWLKHSETSVTDVYFIADSASVGSLNGYALRVFSDERVTLRRVTAGAHTAIFGTAVGAVSPDEWIRIRIARRYDGRFSVYINDDLAAASVGTNPVTDNTHQNGSYILVDLDAGDAVGPIGHRWGEVL